MQKSYKFGTFSLSACFLAVTLSSPVNAGLLPWDNWIYHLDHKKKEIQNLHKSAVDLQMDIQDQSIVFNKELDKYRDALASNQVLLGVYATTKMNEEQWSQYKVETEFPDGTGDTIHQALLVGQAISELVVGVQVGGVIINFGKMAYKGIFQAGEEAAEVAAEEMTEVGVDAGVTAATAGAEVGVELTTETVGIEVSEVAAEVAVESATTSTLASTGIGIFAAVGIDAIFGAIDGAREASALDEHIDKLRQSINKSQTYHNEVVARKAQLDANMLQEMDRFKRLVEALAELSDVHPKFNYNFATNLDSIADFLSAQDSALREYSTLQSLRVSWDRYRVKHDDSSEASAERFLDTYSEVMAPEHLSAQEITKMWNVLAEFSESVPPVFTGWPQQIHMSGAHYPDISDGVYNLTTAYDGKPVYTNNSGYSIYQRNDGHWFLDFDDVNENWNGTLNYTTAPQNVPWGGTWTYSAVVTSGN